MLFRLQAALDARTDPDFLIIARTDSRAVEGFDAAIVRAKAYRDLGVDAIFFEQPQSVDELRRVGEELRGTVLVANMVERSKTPLLPAHELLALGFQIILFANAALYLGSYAIKKGLAVLRHAGTTESLLHQMLTFEERQHLVGLRQADEAERDLVAHDARDRTSVTLEHTMARNVSCSAASQNEIATPLSAVCLMTAILGPKPVRRRARSLWRTISSTHAAGARLNGVDADQMIQGGAACPGLAGGAAGGRGRRRWRRHPGTMLLMVR